MTKKKKSKVRKVYAVGLAAMNPNFVVVFHIHSPKKGDKVFAYPPDNEDEEFHLPKQTDDSKNYVILTAPEKYHELYRHAKRIYRLLICGKGQIDQLLSIGVPIIDAEIKNGKVIRSLSFKTTEELQRIIEEDADLIKIVPKNISSKSFPSKKPVEKQPKKKSTTSSKKSKAPDLLSILKEIKGSFSGDNVEYQDAVLIPTILRIIRDMNRDEFKEHCKLLEENVENKKLCRKLYAFSEKKWDVGGGRRLSKASRLCLNSKKPKKIEVVAKKYNLSKKDLKWVLNAVKKLEAAISEG